MKDAAFYLKELQEDHLPGFPEERSPLLNERCGAFGEIPLHVYAVRGDVAALRALLEAGSEVDVRGECGFTPLHEAVSQGHTEAVRLLLAHGADPALSCDFGDALMLADDYPEIIALIRSN